VFGLSWLRAEELAKGDSGEEGGSLVVTVVTALRCLSPSFISYFALARVAYR